MIVAVIKDGMVTAKVNVPDGSELKILDNASDAKVYDLYDGTTFSDNPAAAALKAFAQDVASAQRQIAAAKTKAEARAVLSALESVFEE